MQNRTTHTPTRPDTGQCPSWCGERSHPTPFDRAHVRLREVSLSAHIHAEAGEIYVPTMGAMLWQQPGDGPVITLAGHDDGVEDHLTVDEAEKLSVLLAELVRAARTEAAS